jgi:putative protease
LRSNSFTELLAPAGDVDSLRAAVANGADAVYFGLPNFNARRRAANVALDQLPDTIDYLHRHNVRGYVTFNTLLFGDELAEAADCLQAIAQAGADAVIVQDLGLARLVHRLAPSLPIHASTQMTLTEPAAIEQVRQLGVQRVILARELTLDDIAAIREATDMPLETFVHGALCISYSGLCQASHVLMDRSANRGLCAQPCRLPYDLVLDGRAAPSHAPYVLCPQDLAAYDRVRQLVDLGVAALKIEGRLKNARYVAAAVRAYRAALDAALEHRPFHLADDLRAGIQQSFSRGFTHGFLDGRDHQALVHGESPKSRGIRVGTIAGRTALGLVVNLDPGLLEQLKPGDGLVVGDGRQAEDGELGGRIARVRPRQSSPDTRTATSRSQAAPPPAGDSTVVEITFILDTIDLGRVPVGAVLWKNDDPRLEKELRKTFSRVEPARLATLNVEVWGAAGGTLHVTAHDADGHRAEASWPGPLEAAIKYPLTIAVVTEQFSRLGGTPLALQAVALFGPDGPVTELPIMVPKSVLNDLRRQVVDAILEQRHTESVHAVADADALPRLRQELSDAWPGDGAIAAATTPQLLVLVRSEAQLRSVLACHAQDGHASPAMVYVELRQTRDCREAVNRCRDAGLPVGLVSRRILRCDELSALDALIDLRPDAVLARNLGSLVRCRDRAPDVTVVADASLNVANELSAGVLADWGVRRFTPAVELDADRLAALTRQVPPELIEVVIHQRLPMFHTEHCVFAARLSGGHNRSDCGQPCRRVEAALRDRAGADLPLSADGGCRNTVFSPTVHSSRQRLPALLALGLRHFRVEFLRETPDQVADLLSLYAQALVPA